MEIILLALINNDKFKATETNQGTAIEMANFIKTFNKNMLSNY